MRDDIVERLIDFRKERNWMQFHTPENLAKSIVIEAAELLQLFQWGLTPDTEKGIKNEVADILIYLTYLCHDLRIDPFNAMRLKITENEKKYPVSKARGNARKYTEL